LKFGSIIVGLAIKELPVPNRPLQESCYGSSNLTGHHLIIELFLRVHSTLGERGSCVDPNSFKSVLGNREARLKRKFGQWDFPHCSVGLPHPSIDGKT
jgi:hypothetical protein